MTEKDFNHIILPLAKHVYTYASHLLGNSEDAADTTQDVMIKLWEQRKKAAQPDNPLAWMLAVTRNLCLDRMRCRKPTKDETDILQSPSSEDIQEQLENRDSARLILRLIDNLPDNLREVMVLREIQELDFEEIAQITGLTPNHIRVLLSRGRNKIREQLKNI